jgi:hypothetical protein
VAITLFIFVIEFLNIKKLKRSVKERIEWISDEMSEK